MYSRATMQPLRLCNGCRRGSRPAQTAEKLTSLGAGPVLVRRHRFATATEESDRTNLRVVPASPSYFTGRPQFTDALLELQALLRRHQLLPRLPQGEVPRVAWKTLPQASTRLGNEKIRSGKFHKMLQVLQRLHQIHPQVMPQEVVDALAPYKRTVHTEEVARRPNVIDLWGRALGVGRRKSSTAQVWLVEGDGKVIINGKSMQDVFATHHDRESALWPLVALKRLDKYNVWALIQGGGTTGQAEAMTLGLAKALLVHEPLLKPALRRAGCITRDPRAVERKKPGRLKARKKPAWVKR